LHVLSLPPAFALSQDQTLKLDEIDLGKSQRFDEVPPLNIREACAPKTVKGVDLKRVPPKSLIRPPFEQDFSRRQAVRRDSAVHVSLSSDLPFKQPGTDESPSPRQTGEPSKQTSDKAGCLSHRESCGASEARHRADVRQRAEELIYRVSKTWLSTLESRNQIPIVAGKAVFNWLFAKHKSQSREARCAAVTPHSSVVLSSRVNGVGLSGL
jgi:hypothetical protein